MLVSEEEADNLMNMKKSIKVMKLERFDEYSSRSPRGGRGRGRGAPEKKRIKMDQESEELDNSSFFAGGFSSIKGLFGF